MTKLVNTRQLIFILLISLFGTKVLLLPNLMSKDFGRDSYLFLLLLMVFDLLILLALLFLMNKFRGKSFYEILEYLFGKIVAKIMMFLFFGFFFLKSCAVFQSNFVFLNENLYTTFNWYIFSVPILVVAIFCAINGVNSLARLIEFFAPIIIVGAILAIVSGVARADFTNLLPVLENGSEKFQKIFNYSFWFGDYVILLVFFGNVKQEEKFNLKIILYVILGMIGLCFFFAVFYATYNYNSICHTNAISDILQILPSSSDLGSFDWILILVWDITLFLSFALYNLGAFYSLRQTFKINSHIVVACIIAVGVFALNYFTNFDIYLSIELAQSYFSDASIIIQYFLPIFIFLAGAIKPANFEDSRYKIPKAKKESFKYKHQGERL